MVNGVYITQGRPANQLECKVTKTHKEIVRIMVFSLPCQKDGQATSNTKARAPLPGFSRVIWDEWGKKGVRMDTKALKKQMGAAIAMVLVAAVALGSATFAWFVSNNEVTAKTTGVKAQSNTAFMSIEYKKSAIGTQTTNSVDWTDLAVALYPAEVQSDGATAPAPKFVTAYGTTTDNGAKKGDYIEVGDATKAVADQYAIGQVDNYSISSAGVDLTNLKIDKVEVSTGADKGLKDAIRVLVVGPDSWQVWGPGENADAGLKLEKTKGAALATTVAKDKDTKLSVYVYYDGNDNAVTTKNLSNILESVGVTIHFSATQPTTISTANGGN